MDEVFIIAGVHDEVREFFLGDFNQLTGMREEFNRVFVADEVFMFAEQIEGDFRCHIITGRTGIVVNEYLAAYLGQDRIIIGFNIFRAEREIIGADNHDSVCTGIAGIVGKFYCIADAHAARTNHAFDFAFDIGYSNVDEAFLLFHRHSKKFTCAAHNDDAVYTAFYEEIIDHFIAFLVYIAYAVKNGDDRR